MIAQSVLIHNLVQGFDGTNQAAIPLANVNARTLRKVLEWCHHHVGEPAPDRDAPTDRWMNAWDKEYVNVDRSTLFEMVLAANYLDIQGLLNTCCKAVANLLTGKSPRELRQMLNIRSDFSEEQEAANMAEWEREERARVQRVAEESYRRQNGNA